MAIGLCEEWMSRQTYTGAVEWLVASDGEDELRVSRPGWTVHRLLRAPESTPIRSFVGNLLAAADAATGDLVAIVEDDDWYDADHLQHVVEALHTTDATGNLWQNYYHLPSRQWIRMRNRGACLCQTAFRVGMLDTFRQACQTALRKRSIGVDALFWSGLPTGAIYGIDTTGHTVIGIKGLPGRPGLGVGHRPDKSRAWNDDPDLRQLEAWVGVKDAGIYRAMMVGA